MLNIIVNGKPVTVEKSTSVAEALDELGFEGKHFAVALNEDFVPKTAYTETPIHDGDQLEVLAPLRGG